MKVLIGMPNTGKIPYQTVMSLFQLTRKMEHAILGLLESSSIHDARNTMALDAIANGCDYLLFIDSDMVFEPDAFEKLMAMDADIATGVYYGRAGEHKPIVYKKLTPRSEPTEGNVIGAVAENFTEIPEGTFEVAGCGMGMCLIKAEVLKKLCDMYQHSPFDPMDGFGEDLSFCVRATANGFKIKANSYIPLGHVGTRVYNKDDYRV